MRISNNLNSSPRCHFNGIRVATSKYNVDGATTRLDIYQVCKKDEAFLQKLKSSVNLEELMPDKRISEYAFSVWQAVFELGVDRASQLGYKGYLIAKDNKPCGVMAYKPNPVIHKLESVCTWPVETGKKVPLAGQVLFQQLFRDFSESGASRLELDAVVYGPYSVIPKYTKLGFYQTGGENHYVQMRANKEVAQKSLKRLDGMLDTTYTNSRDDLNLFDVLEL